LPGFLFAASELDFATNGASHLSRIFELGVQLLPVNGIPVTSR